MLHRALYNKICCDSYPDNQKKRDNAILISMKKEVEFC